MHKTGNKVFVKVLVQYDEYGNKRPLELEWEDGRCFEIDRIIDICKAASLKAGGAGTRYTVQILGKIRYLFLEDERWFVEGNG